MAAFWGYGGILPAAQLPYKTTTSLFLSTKNDLPFTPHRVTRLRGLGRTRCSLSHAQNCLRLHPGQLSLPKAHIKHGKGWLYAQLRVVVHLRAILKMNKYAQLRVVMRLRAIARKKRCLLRDPQRRLALRVRSLASCMSFRDAVWHVQVDCSDEMRPNGSTSTCGRLF